MKKIIITLLFISSLAQANYLDDNLRKENWNGIDVIWLLDESLPTFDVIFYFDQGSVHEDKRKSGVTELMFSELTSGTHRFNQAQIVESLEFFGINYGSRVTHEFSSFGVSGLDKSFNPALKLVCHLFNSAKFPAKELKKTKRRIEASVKGMVSNHGSLADHIFRKESMRGSGYDIPTTGNLKSLNRVKSSDLKQRLSDLNKSAYKRIYLRGGKKLIELKSIIKNDCQWSQGQRLKSLPEVTQISPAKVILVPVPNANQAQVRVGRIMTKSEVNEGKSVQNNFAAKYLGGGFSGRLIQELRVDKGLTYSAGSYIAAQKNYGRVGISTFTKNSTLIPLLKGIEEVVAKNAQKIPQDLFTLSLNNVKGNYLLGLESTSDFLKNLLYFDHVGRDYNEIYKFTDKMNKITMSDLADTIKKYFQTKDQTVVIVGDKSLKEVLEQAGYVVKQVKYQDYL